MSLCGLEHLLIPPRWVIGTTDDEVQREFVEERAGGLGGQI